LVDLSPKKELPVKENKTESTPKNINFVDTWESRYSKQRLSLNKFEEPLRSLELQGRQISKE
jgi:hypothetical protein